MRAEILFGTVMAMTNHNGLYMHGAIDGLSRFMLWLNVYKTNNDPKIVAGYHLETVQSVGGSPKRCDFGTENAVIEVIQTALYWKFSIMRHVHLVSRLTGIKPRSRDPIPTRPIPHQYLSWATLLSWWNLSRQFPIWQKHCKSTH